MEISALENKKLQGLQDTSLQIQISAAAIGSSFLLILVPNIETITFTAFLMGYLFSRRFAFTTVITMVAAWEVLASIVFSFSQITFLFKLLAWLIIALLGIFARKLGVVKPVEFAIFGAFSALVFDILVTIPYAFFFIGQKVGFVSIITSSFIFGLHFTLFHTLGNVFLFLFMPRVINVVYPLLSTRYAGLLMTQQAQLDQLIEHEIGEEEVEMAYARIDLARRKIFRKRSLLAVLAIITAAFLIFSSISSIPEEEQPVAKDITISLQINYAGVLANISHSINTYDNQTVFDMLELYVTLNYTMYGKLVYIHAINDVWENDDLKGHYWIFYINGVQAQQAANMQKMKDNDTVVWNYEN